VPKKRHQWTLGGKSKRFGIFRSGLEKDVAEDLEKRDIKYTYEGQKLSYVVEKTYTPDFEVNGMLIETKGYFYQEDQRKMRLVRDQNPGLDIRFVFTRSASGLQGSKMTCAEWCEKYNFKYAEKTIPESWMETVNGEEERD
jgi:hypothetical protein